MNKCYELIGCKQLGTIKKNNAKIRKAYLLAFITSEIAFEC